MASLLAALPTRAVAAMAAATAKLLTTYSEDEVWLGDAPSWMFREEAAAEVFQRFRAALHRIEEEIEERNKELDVPYTILLPSRSPAGTAI